MGSSTLRLAAKDPAMTKPRMRAPELRPISPRAPCGRIRVGMLVHFRRTIAAPIRVRFAFSPMARRRTSTSQSFSHLLLDGTSDSRFKMGARRDRHSLLFSPQRHPPKRGTPIHDRLTFYHNRLLPTQLQQRAPPLRRSPSLLHL
eukprot:scaffold4641_cov117-Isochrysis_galbana.AAC.6